MIRTLVLVFQLLAAMVVALAARVARRIFSGPIVPGWGWDVELKAVALRSFIMSAATHPDPLARAKLEGKLDPPLPRQLRAAMAIKHDTVAGVPVERHIRNGAGTDLTDTATILYFHGGGYLAGSPATHRRFVANLTWAIGGSAVVPHYRLAPEHPFPAAGDDAIAVYRALLAGGTDPNRIVIAGDSAGGGLTLATLLRLRDEGDPLPAGAIVFSPYTDLEHTGNSIYRNTATDYLPLLHPVRPLHEYLGDHDSRDPYASPMYGDYTGIPPLLVFAGGREMILDDSVRLARKAQSDGCEVSLHVADDMFHVWPALLPNHAETLKLLAMCREWVTARP